jgi:hypothetical protein
MFCGAPLNMGAVKSRHAACSAVAFPKSAFTLRVALRCDRAGQRKSSARNHRILTPTAGEARVFAARRLTGSLPDPDDLEA